VLETLVSAAPHCHSPVEKEGRSAPRKGERRNYERLIGWKYVSGEGERGEEHTTTSTSRSGTTYSTHTINSALFGENGGTRQVGRLSIWEVERREKREGEQAEDEGIFACDTD
jgi:hypothetical protein